VQASTTLLRWLKRELDRLNNEVERLLEQLRLLEKERDDR
jgi:hypothetical protein